MKLLANSCSVVIFYNTGFTAGDSMKRYTKKRSKKAWMAPGTLVHIGEKTVDITGVTVIDYSETELREETLHTIEECFLLKDKPHRYLD